MTNPVAKLNLEPIKETIDSLTQLLDAARIQLADLNKKLLEVEKTPINVTTNRLARMREIKEALLGELTIRQTAEMLDTDYAVVASDIKLLKQLGELKSGDYITERGGRRQRG